MKLGMSCIAALGAERLPSARGGAAMQLEDDQAEP